MANSGGIVGEIKRVFNQQDLDTLILFVTNACNLKCGFCCYADNLNQARDISHENMLQISRTMPKFRCLLLSGGEPFIRPKLDEIMLAFVRNNGITSISIPTNGWYLERTDQVCRSFLDQNRDVMLTINFSVDGMEPTHNAIRGRPETFANLLKTLEHLSPWREKYPNLRLRVHSVVTPDNIGGIKETIDFFYQNYEVDEHGLEIVRDQHYHDAQHESAEKKATIGPFLDLVRYAYELYFKNEGKRRGKLGYLPEGLSHFLNYAHNLAMNEVKRDRIEGKLWPFPCTAGRKIVVISGSGSLSACEHRPQVVDLREHNFDVGKALATRLMEKERAQIRKDRCDCIHGCFIGNSIQHSPGTILTRIMPKAVSYLRRSKARQPATTHGTADGEAAPGKTSSATVEASRP